MIDVVCLSEGYDLKAKFDAAIADHAPGLRLINPSDCSDPKAVKFALAHDPAPGAFDIFSELQLICAWGAGVDGLLLHPGLPKHVAIKRMTDPAQAQMMAAFAAYYVTGWQRRMFDYPRQQASREWHEVNTVMPQEFPVGLLGFGKMGEAVAHGLAAMGFPVTAWASRVRTEPDAKVLAGAEGFDRVVSGSAALINVLPLTPATDGLLNAEVFMRMRKDAILIQLARGAHLNEPDLLAALDKGRPAMAALDVMTAEPLPEDSPLWSHPRIMITPHIASSASPAGVARSVAEGIAAFAEGDTPDGLVDRARGY